MSSPDTSTYLNSENESTLDRERLAVGLWVRIAKVYSLVLREIRERILADCTIPQFDVMASLMRTPDGIPLVELSRRLLVTAGNITGIIDRMVRDGLVVRAPDAKDRRVVRVRLTPKGRRRAGVIVPKHSKSITDILAVLTPPEQKLFKELLEKLRYRLSRAGEHAD